jgi:hypothetical protein
MNRTLLKKYYVFFFTTIVFLLVFAQQHISGTNESKFPGNDKLKLLWEFDSGG